MRVSKWCSLFLHMKKSSVVLLLVAKVMETWAFIIESCWFVVLLSAKGLGWCV